MNGITLFDTIFGDMMDGCGTNTVYHSAVYAPRVDVKSDEKAYTLEMDLPGRTENDVNIELDRNTLTISSKENEEVEEKKNDKKDVPEKTMWLIHERRTTSFKREFTLPEDVNQEEITASFKNGVLTLTMPRAEVKAPKKISIIAA